MRLFGRLGLEELYRDHAATLVEYDEDGATHRSLPDYLVFGAIPVVLGGGALLAKLQLVAVEGTLAGVSILTGLLFGLLVHVLSVGMTLARDERVSVNSRIVRLTNELRANVSWACGVGLALTTLLTLISSFVPLGEKGQAVPVWATAIVLLLGTHLVGTLLMILKRVRSTYRIIGK